MDDSARAYVQKLAKLGDSRTMPEITNLTNQLTLEVMVATIFGDQSFNLLAIDGKHIVYDALLKIRKSSLYKLDHH